MSKVIKNFDASTQKQASRAFDMAEVGEEAQQIIASAEETAAQLIHEAETEAEVLRKQASEKGIEEGKAAVKGRLEQQLAEEIRNARSRDVANLVRTLQTVLAEINEYRDRLVRESKEQLIELAINVARSVIKREVQCAGDVAQLNLDEAIRLSVRRSKLLVRISEMDMKTLEDTLGEQPLPQEGESGIEIVASPEILPGGCLVESASGSVDARIETQLREIEKTLLGTDDNV